MNLLLDDLIKEAEQNVLPASHGQRESDHVWIAVGGGRACPRQGGGSQAIYECQLCGIIDYGDLNGPGWHDCFDHSSGCQGCFNSVEEMDFPLSDQWNPVDEFKKTLLL